MVERCIDQARMALLAQAIAVAADGHDVAVVQQAIEDRGGDNRIAEHGVKPQFRNDCHP